MKSSVLRAVSLFMLVALVLAGCGSGGKTTKVSEPGTVAPANNPAVAPPAQTPEPAKQALTVRIGGTDRESLKHLPLFLDSFGKSQAVKVEFKEYSSGTKMAQGLLAKEIDFAVLTVEHVLRDTSDEMRMVTLLTRYPGLVLLVNNKYKDQIKGVQDLVGKKVGVSGMGGASHQFLLTLAQKNKIDPSSLVIEPVGLNAVEIFQQDKVVATVSLEPFVTQVTKSGAGVILVDARKADGTAQVYGVPEIAQHALVTRPDLITANPDMVKRTMAAVTESLQTIATASVDDLVTQTPKSMYPAGDAALYKEMLQANRAAFSVNGKLTQQLLDPVWNNMKALGGVPKDKQLEMGKVVATP